MVPVEIRTIREFLIYRKKLCRRIEIYIIKNKKNYNVSYVWARFWHGAIITTAFSPDRLFPLRLRSICQS